MSKGILIVPASPLILRDLLYNPIVPSTSSTQSKTLGSAQGGSEMLCDGYFLRGSAVFSALVNERLECDNSSKICQKRQRWNPRSLGGQKSERSR